MVRRASSAESLAAFVLRRTEPDVPDHDHLDEDALALLEAGAPGAEELEVLRAHLAGCVRCRRIAGASFGGPEASAVARAPWGARRLAWGAIAAAAACLLLAILPRLIGDGEARRLARARQALQAGDRRAALDELRPLLTSATTGPGPRAEAQTLARDAFGALMAEALRRGDFDRVEAQADEADRLGVRSPRIASLHAQAVRRMPGLLALNCAGRLDHFGQALQSPFIKALPEEDPGALRALRLLDAVDAADSTEREAYLNRAHALLRQDPGAAGAAFDRWLGRHPDDRDALLGRGLAEYLAGNFAASAATFEAVLRSRPDDLDARVNAAFALERAGRPDAALDQWREVLRRADDPDLRAKVEVRLRVLERSRKVDRALPATRVLRHIRDGATQPGPRPRVCRVDADVLRRPCSEAESMPA